MYLTIEKVAFLKTVDIFSDTPDYILASVARIANEVEFASKEMIIEEGDYGDSMYIVVDGNVRVHKGDRDILTVGPGESVGELAVLDPEPRAASVSAIDDVYMFRIDKAPFDEVMADRPEIAQGIIRALCGRIRSQGRILTDETTLNTSAPVKNGQT